MVSRHSVATRASRHYEKAEMSGDGRTRGSTNPATRRQLEGNSKATRRHLHPSSPILDECYFYSAMEMFCYDAHLGCLNWSDDLQSATPRILPICHPIVLLYGVVVLRTTVFRFIAYCPAYLDSCLTSSTLRTRAPAKAYLHSHVKNISIQPSGLNMTSILSSRSLNSQNQLWRVT
jgi:hypothetical protein